MTVIPPTTAPNLPAVVAAAAGPTVTIPQPPPQLLQLAPGTTIDAVVVSTSHTPPADDAAQADARQTVILRTPAGDVAVRTNAPLDDGARVALEVLRNAPNQLTTRVVTINDVPARQALAQAARDSNAAPPDTDQRNLTSQTNAPRAPVIAVGRAWTPAGPAPLPTIQPLSAFVLNAAPLPASAPATGLNTFLPGSDLSIRVVSVQTAPSIPTPGQASSNISQAALPAGTPQATKHATPALIQSTPAANPAFQAATPNATSSNQPTPTNLALNAGGVKVTTPTQLASTPNRTGLQNNPIASLATAPTPQSTPATITPVPIQTTEFQGLRLTTTNGLGPEAPTPPKTVETAPIVTRITGQVTNTAANGATVIQTPSGEIQLNVRANLPPGSTITLEVLSSQPPPADGPVPSPPSPGPTSLPLATATTGWPTVTEALQVLQRADPQTATLLANALPDGGPRTAVATMAFVQAMRSGDARQWPGDTALRGLERAGPRGAQLASQIASEVREMAARTPETQSDWRTTPMPWNLEGRIERVNLISRREDAGEDESGAKKKGGKGKGTRFLVNLDLSQLGEMQLDGMFVKSTRGFDLMVRTKQALPEDMRRDLSGLFANSNANLGLKGALTFQVVKKFADPTNTKGPAQDRGGFWA